MGATTWFFFKVLAGDKAVLTVLSPRNSEVWNLFCHCRTAKCWSWRRLHLLTTTTRMVTVRCSQPSLNFPGICRDNVWCWIRLGHNNNMFKVNKSDQRTEHFFFQIPYSFFNGWVTASPSMHNLLPAICKKRLKNLAATHGHSTRSRHGLHTTTENERSGHTQHLIE